MAIISRGVEISVAGGGGDKVRLVSLGRFFFSLFSFFLLSCMICFKIQTASCSASYGENKTYKQKPRPASPLHGKHQAPRIHRKSPPRLAPMIKPPMRKGTIHINVQVKRPKPFHRPTKTKGKTLTARNAARGTGLLIGDIGKLQHRAHRNHDVRSGRSLHRSNPLHNRHGGSAIPQVGVTEEGPTDGKGTWRA